MPFNSRASRTQVTAKQFLQATTEVTGKDEMMSGPSGYLPSCTDKSISPTSLAVSRSAGNSTSAFVSPTPAMSRRTFDLDSLHQILEVATQSASVQMEGLDEWNDSTWDETVKLRPLLSLVAEPDFVPPPHFQQAMDTCMACLLHAPQGKLCKPQRMLQLVESADAQALLKYLVWLEDSLKQISPSSHSSGAASCRTVLVPERVRSALSSWSAERALLQQSATALCEAIASYGPQYQQSCNSWRKFLEEREAIQKEQKEGCQRVARDIDGVVAFFAEQIQENSSAEWPELARITQASLCRIQQLSTDLLQSQQETWSQALEDYEALALRSTAARNLAADARRQVRKFQQAFSQAAQRFIEIANQLLAWSSVLVPKLQLLIRKRIDLRAAVDLRQKIPVLEREHLQTEDELDAAQIELRRHKRHSQAASKPRATTASPSDGATAFVLERQYELRISNAQQRVAALEEELQEAEKRLQEIEANFPFQLVADEDAGATGSTVPETKSRDCLSNEEKLALKLAKLQQFHEELVVEVAETQVERDKILRKVEKRRVEAALRRHLEPDFMCPILHERMKVPVLAADGFTYEREAIEKWLAMHNTSPMTGAALAHRYLTENFALRHLIDAYDAQLSSGRRLPRKTKPTEEKQVEKSIPSTKDEPEEDLGELDPSEEESIDDEDEDLEEDEDEDELIAVGGIEEDMPFLSHPLDDG